MRRSRAAASATDRSGSGFEVGQRVGGVHAERGQAGVVERASPAHGHDRDAVRPRPPCHAGHGLAREGLLVEGALPGDDQAGAGQGGVEVDEVEHDVDSRAAFGAEHGEQREPHAPGRPRPRLVTGDLQ